MKTKIKEKPKNGTLEKDYTFKLTMAGLGKREEWRSVKDYW